MTENIFLSGRKRLYYSLMSYFHLFIRKFFSWRIHKAKNKAPQKILLSNCGRFGDLVLSTGFINAIKAAYPECRIGILILKETIEICKTLPSVDWIHTTDLHLEPESTHWQIITHFFHFVLFQQSKIAKEISKIKYDWAIELRPFFPNLIPVFWKAKIPIRIGFTTSGNGNLLTAPAKWEGGQYLSQCYRPLLALIGLGHTEMLMPQLPLQESTPLLTKKPYFIFHLCSFNAAKELPLEFWKALYLKCQKKGFTIYFTGKGKRELQIIEQITTKSEENLCNRLSWSGFTQHIKESKGLVSVDSASIHIAAVFHTPTAALFVQSDYSLLWTPAVNTTTAFGTKSPIQVEEVFQLICGWESENATAKKEPK